MLVVCWHKIFLNAELASVPSLWEYLAKLLRVDRTKGKTCFQKIKNPFCCSESGRPSSVTPVERFLKQAAKKCVSKSKEILWFHQESCKKFWEMNWPDAFQFPSPRMSLKKAQLVSKMRHWERTSGQDTQKKNLKKVGLLKVWLQTNGVQILSINILEGKLLFYCWHHSVSLWKDLLKSAASRKLLSGPRCLVCALGHMSHLSLFSFRKCMTRRQWNEVQILHVWQGLGSKDTNTGTQSALFFLQEEQGLKSQRTRMAEEHLQEEEAILIQRSISRFRDSVFWSWLTWDFPLLCWGWPCATRISSLCLRSLWCHSSYKREWEEFHASHSLPIVRRGWNS